MSRNIKDAIDCLRGLKSKSGQDDKKIEKKIKELEIYLKK